MLKIAWRYLYQDKLYLSIVVASCIVSASISVLSPYLTARFIDVVLVMHSKEYLIWFVGIFVFLAVIEIIFGYFSNVFSAKLQAKASFDFNSELITHTQKLPLNYFHQHSSAYLAQRINEDTNSLIAFVLGNLISIIVNLLSLVGVLVLLWSVEPIILPWFLLVLLIYLVIYKTFKIPLRNIALLNKEAQNNFFANLEQQFRFIKFIKINVLYDDLGKKLRGHFYGLLAIILKRTKLAYWFLSSGKIARQLFTITIFGVGGWQVLKGEMTIGSFVAVNMYFAIAIGCVTYFLSLGQNYQDNAASYCRIRELLDYDTPREGCIELSNLSTIEVEHLKYHYPDSPKSPIISDFNYSFRCGNVYCVVGPNGAGKTTLMYLLMGILKPISGKILVNGLSLSDVDTDKWRRNMVSFLEQEPILFKDTLLNNLLLGNGNRDDVGVWLKRIKLKNIFGSNRDLNYMIDEQLTKISGGEKQKIAQVRVLLKATPLIILDEPISAIDYEGVETIKSIITELKRDKIIICITHNRELLEVADDVIEMS